MCVCYDNNVSMLCVFFYGRSHIFLYVIRIYRRFNGFNLTHKCVKCVKGDIWGHLSDCVRRSRCDNVLAMSLER